MTDKYYPFSRVSDSEDGLVWDEVKNLEEELQELDRNLINKNYSKEDKE